jgi:hypothetical protein
MEPEKFGRTLGIGVRVASNIARDRAAKAMAGKNQPSPPPAAIPRAPIRTGETARAFSQGTRQFGHAFFGPLRRAGSALWLEINGVFFAFFTFFFGQSAYRVHAAWRQGPEHTHFLLYVAFTIVFGWFSLSSFLRARRKQKNAACG